MTGVVPLPSSLRGYHSIGWRIKKKQYLTSHYEIKSNTMSAFTVLSVAPLPNIRDRGFKYAFLTRKPPCLRLALSLSAENTTESSYIAPSSTYSWDNNLLTVSLPSGSQNRTCKRLVLPPTKDTYSNIG